VRGRPEPLYRRVNTRARGVQHGGGEARWARNTKAALDEGMRGSMHAGQRNGLDYTPLFRFLLSRVGQDWDVVRSEALSRLDGPEPLYWIVARGEAEERAFVRVGENSYWSGLKVDAANRLALVAPDLSVDDMVPGCGCCTHTLNGERFKRGFEGL
jgi:hypothetical protein